MERLKIKGWEEGFRKISFTKLLTEYCELSLSEAKEITDNFLENDEAYIVIKDQTLAKEFIAKAMTIGVKSITK